MKKTTPGPNATPDEEENEEVEILPVTPPLKVLVKRQVSNETVPFEDHPPQLIANEFLQMYDKLKALAEPLFEDEHWQNTPVHETFRPSCPVNDFQIAPRRGVEDGAPAAPARVPSKGDNNYPLLRMK